MATEPAKSEETPSVNSVRKLFHEIDKINERQAKREKEEDERRHTEEVKAARRYSLLAGISVGAAGMFVVWFLFVFRA